MMNKPAAPGVLRRTVMHALDEDGVGKPIDAELGYDLQEPYAVVTRFLIGAGEVVEWSFARDLLAEGLTQLSGIGDVRVLRYPTHTDQLLLSLTSGDESALLLVTADAVEAFLEATYLLCPRGDEHRFVDIDAALVDLLQR